MWAAMTGCLAVALARRHPGYADDANPGSRQVNGAEIRQATWRWRRRNWGPSLAQMDPATKKDNVLSF